MPKSIYIYVYFFTYYTCIINVLYMCHRYSTCNMIYFSHRMKPFTFPPQCIWENSKNQTLYEGQWQWCALFFTAWAALIGFGGLLTRSRYAYKYPVTTAGCNMTDPALYANISSPVYDPATYRPQDHYRFVCTQTPYTVLYTEVFISRAFTDVSYFSYLKN